MLSAGDRQQFLMSKVQTFSLCGNLAIFCEGAALLQPFQIQSGKLPLVAEPTGPSGHCACACNSFHQEAPSLWRPPNPKYPFGYIQRPHLRGCEVRPKDGIWAGCRGRAKRSVASLGGPVSPAHWGHYWGKGHSKHTPGAYIAWT